MFLHVAELMYKITFHLFFNILMKIFSTNIYVQNSLNRYESLSSLYMRLTLNKLQR